MKKGERATPGFLPPLRPELPELPSLGQAVGRGKQQDNTELCTFDFSFLASRAEPALDVPLIPKHAH